MIEDQPPPVPSDGPAVVDLVTADLAERKQLGIQRYGMPLRAHNGRDALVDAYQEALDLVCYLRQVLAEQGESTGVDLGVRLGDRVDKANRAIMRAQPVGEPGAHNSGRDAEVELEDVRRFAHRAQPGAHNRALHGPQPGAHNRALHGPRPAPPDIRPYRSPHEPGDERHVHTRDDRGLTWRQVGWHGQSGAFYALGEDPGPHEPGSFSPLWVLVEDEPLITTEGEPT